MGSTASADEKSAALRRKFSGQNEVMVRRRSLANQQLPSFQFDLLFEAVQQEYPGLIHSITESAVVTDHTLQDEPIVFCSDQFLSMTGYSSEEVLGRNCRFLQGEYTDPNNVEKIRRALRRGSSTEVELVNYRKDGNLFINHFILLPVHVGFSPDREPSIYENYRVASFQCRVPQNIFDAKPTHYIAVQKDVTLIVNPFREPVLEWSIPEVLMFIDCLGLGHYLESFRGINGETLQSLSDVDLQNLGVEDELAREKVLLSVEDFTWEKMDDDVYASATSLLHLSVEQVLDIPSFLTFCGRLMGSYLVNFLLELREFRRSPSVALYHQLCERYIKSNSPLSLHLSGKLRDEVVNAKPFKDFRLFDNVRDWVVEELARNLIPNFLRSSEFKKSLSKPKCIFDVLYQSSFRTFLESFGELKLLHFLEKNREFKHNPTAQMMEEIVTDFVQPDSRYDLKLTDDCRSQVVWAIKVSERPHPGIFDPAEDEVFKAFNAGIFHEFVNSTEDLRFQAFMESDDPQMQAMLAPF